MTFSNVSYLRPRDVDQIGQARRNMLATRISLQRAGPVVVHRLDSSGADTALPAQTDVYVGAGRSGMGMDPLGRIPGLLQRLQPFDVQVGDTFVLANGWTGTVMQVEPVQDGIVTAQTYVQTESRRRA